MENQTPIKPKKERTPAQIEAFNKAKEKRLEVLRLKKEAYKRFEDKIDILTNGKQYIDEVDKEKTNLNDKKKQLDDLVGENNKFENMIKEAQQKKKEYAKKTIFSDSEDEIVLKKPKKKDVKEVIEKVKPKKKIVYKYISEDESEEEEIIYKPKKQYLPKTNVIPEKPLINQIRFF
jgi:chromosome segregation ATPase